MNNNKIFILLVSIFVFLCFLVLLEWSILPILPDETSYLYMTSRYLVDNGRSQIWPLCFDERTLSIPFFLVPQAIILSTWNYIQNPQILRWLAIFFNITSLFFYWKLIYNSIPIKKILFIVFFVITNLFLFIELMPIAIVAHRAEYLWIAFFTYSLYLIKKNYGAINFLIFIFFYSILCFIHPKYFYFLPFVLFLTASSCNSKFYIRILLALLLGILSYFLLKINIIQFLSCKNLPEMAEVNKSFNIDINDLITNSNNSIIQFIKNISPSRWDILINRASFSQSYSDQTNFLPHISVNESINTRLLLNKIFYFLSIVFLSTFAYSLFYTLFKSIKFAFINNYYKSKIYTNLFLLGSGLLLNILLNRAQAFYDSVTWLTLIALYSTYIISNVDFKARIKFTKNFVNYINITILSIAIFIILLNLYFISKYIYNPIRFQKQENGISLINKSYKINSIEVNSLASACGVNLHKDKLITDDYAYYLVQPSPHTTPLTWLWYGFNLRNKFTNDQDMYSTLWSQTENYASNYSYKAVVANCPSLAIGFNDKKLFKSSSENWNDSLCCYKF